MAFVQGVYLVLVLLEVMSYNTKIRFIIYKNSFGRNNIIVDFILDERARELAGEYHRWMDLKRTGRLIR